MVGVGQQGSWCAAVCSFPCSWQLAVGSRCGFAWRLAEECSDWGGEGSQPSHSASCGPNPIPGIEHHNLLRQGEECGLGLGQDPAPVCMPRGTALSGRDSVEDEGC